MSHMHKMKSGQLWRHGGPWETRPPRKGQRSSTFWQKEPQNTAWLPKDQLSRRGVQVVLRSRTQASPRATGPAQSESAARKAALRTVRQALSLGLGFLPGTWFGTIIPERVAVAGVEVKLLLFHCKHLQL